jgi:hypothetical protein
MWFPDDFERVDALSALLGRWVTRVVHRHRDQVPRAPQPIGA